MFIPIFLAHIERGDHDRGWESFSVIANFIVLVGTVGIGVLMVFARPLAALVAPGFTDPTDVDTLVRLSRIVLPAQFFHVIGGLLSAVLQAQNLHTMPAMAPLVSSAGIIAGGLIGAYYPDLGADGFAWGVLAGSIIGPFGLPLFGCLKTKMRWTPLFSLRNGDLKRYLWLSVPIMIGFSIVVVDEWIIKNQASYLAIGGLSHLQYARTLMKVPIGVFGMAAGVAAYPTISGLVAAGNVVEAYALLCRAVRLMLVLTFAAQVCLTIAGFEAVYLIWGLFAHRFTIADAQETSAAMTYLCLGLSGWAAQSVISRGYYALESTWLPTIIGTTVAVIMVPVYVVLRQQNGTIGLAIASSAAITIYVLLLGWSQRKRFEREAATRGATLDGAQGMLGAVLRLALAAAIAVGLGLLARAQVLNWLPDMHVATILLRAALLCTFGISAYAILAWLLGVQELAEIKDIVIFKLRPRGRAKCSSASTA